MPLIVWWLGGVCVVVEALLLASDLGLLGSPLWRSYAYQNGAFWPGLLGGWEPNYAAQPLMMFVTYAFLHGGPWHLAGNMITLLLLGRVLSNLGLRPLLALYVISALGGAALFAAFSTTPQPMVGASGALFGMVGAWQHRDFARDAASGPGRWRLAHALGVLVLLNLVLWVAFAGALAWQAHLGGFIAGWLWSSVEQRWQGRSGQ
ncbi:MAG: rhomboid family intramembrane serine protease [Pseudomonadota bacterium]